MVGRPVSDDIAQLRGAAIQAALAEGFVDVGQTGGRGSAIREAARRLGCDAGTLLSWWRKAPKLPSAPMPSAAAKPKVRVPAGTGRVVGAAKPRRFLLTGAQDDTPVHQPFWVNLQAYAANLDAEIMVGGFTYQKGLFQDHASRTAVFASAVQPYLRHDNVDLGPEIVFCAKMNTLPTAVRPLSGLQTYTRGRWGVFPHAKIQLESVPSLRGHPAMQMTTGVCTVRNYVERKAGLVAEFHHCLGATLVEIDEAGRVFCRQINAIEDGSFQDLTRKVRDGRVEDGHRVEAVTWGDIHLAKIDPDVARACWGFDASSGSTSSLSTMLDELRPRHQAFHDLLDFEPRNHHRRGDPHFAFQMHHRERESVEAEVAACARFLRQTAREWCTSVVVPSNHHEALPRWCREADGRADPVNALFWLRCNLAIYEAIQSGAADFDIFAWAARRHDPLDEIVFLERNGSYVVCQGANGGIECGAHGHLGPNGARGSATSLIRVATKMNVGHAHTPSILDGVYTAGLCGLMDQGYNDGPSSWAASQIVTYSNGKRTLITVQDGRWRA